ncbi:MAG: sensor histidine kinase [Eubacteriales bacterium]
MSIKEYIKQRWYLFVIAGAACIFVLLVVWASAQISKSDVMYAAEGALLALSIFILVDFIKLNSRVKYMREFLDNDCTNELKSNYPLDLKYAQYVQEKVDEFNKYKENTGYEHSSELEFITKWVHDVKVPISAIKLLVENMESSEAQHIEMQLSYIEQNIEKILYNMKAKTFYDDYKISKVSIKKIINKALKNYAVFFSYKAISLKIDIEDIEVFTDEKWSIYIISQLISNAVKYTAAGGEIEIATNRDSSGVALSIKNTGEGIDETEIKNIFRRGYSNYSTRKQKSTGYGLYLSKKMADKMGHMIEAESVHNEYAKFIIYYSSDNITKM